MRNTRKRLTVWAIIVGAILMIPLVTRAPWTTGDFIFGAVVLFGCATVYELTTRNMCNKNHRIAVGVIVATTLVCIWGLAVSGS